MVTGPLSCPNPADMAGCPDMGDHRMSDPAPESVFLEPTVPAEQMLAEAVAAAEPSTPEPKPQDQPDKGRTDWESEATKWKSLARKHEQTAKTNSEAAKRLAEIEDAQKTEQQKLTDRAAAAELLLAQTQAANARLLAAAVHGIPAELIDLLGDGNEEQINERAQLLAEKLAAASPVAPTPAAAPTRPVESLKPGAAPQASDPDPDAWLRKLAGRT